MTIRFTPLGVGDAFSAKYYSSCLAVEAGDTRLLIDCPHPIRKIVAEGSTRAGCPFDIGDIDAVILTHLHADHASGLEGLGYFYKFALGRKATLLVHPTVSERLWAGSLAAGMEQLIHEPSGPPHSYTLTDYFDIVELDFFRAVRVGSFEIECRATVHHVPTTAVRLRSGDRCLGHSADTSFDLTLIDWLSDADKFIHEVNYGVHTPYESLANLPAEVRAKMWLTHYPDDFDLDASIIPVLHEGTSYEV